MKIWDYIKSMCCSKLQSVATEENKVTEAIEKKEDIEAEELNKVSATKYINNSVFKDIVLKDKFSFSMSNGDIIYIEPFYDAEQNSYICEHYDEICDWCELVNCRFIYLPKILSLLITDVERLKYNLPGCDNVADPIEVNVAMRRIYNMYYEFIQEQVDSDLSQPMFLRIDGKNRWTCCEASDDISCLLDDDFESNAVSDIRYELESSDRDIMFYLDPRSKADLNFEFEINKLKEEIAVRVEKLRTYGVEDVIIKELFDYKPRLSRLIITSSFRILLPDYGVEIKMTPLNKAVYLLFLRHKEGILFKHLIDYRDELLSIYNHITRFDNAERIDRSIDLLVDSTNNSINEKCSRIREAFVSQFNDEIAKSYYITGDRQKAKRIQLDRSLVEWKCEL